MENKLGKIIDNVSEKIKFSSIIELNDGFTLVKKRGEDFYRLRNPSGSLSESQFADLEDFRKCINIHSVPFNSEQTYYIDNNGKLFESFYEKKEIGNGRFAVKKTSTDNFHIMDCNGYINEDGFWYVEYLKNQNIILMQKKEHGTYVIMHEDGSYSEEFSIFAPSKDVLNYDDEIKIIVTSDKYYLLDKEGNWGEPYQNLSCHSIYGYYVVQKEDGLYQILDYDGKLGNKEFSEDEIPNDGRYLRDLFCYPIENLEDYFEIVNRVNDQDFYSDRFILVSRQDDDGSTEYMFIDRETGMVGDRYSDIVICNQSESFVVFMGDKKYIRDKEGTLSDCYDIVIPLSGGFFAVKPLADDSEEEVFYIRDNEGNLSVPINEDISLALEFQQDELQDFFKYKENVKNGNYTRISNFNDGFAMLEKDALYYFINLEGDISEGFKWITEYKNGYAVVQKKDNKYYLRDKFGNISERSFDALDSIPTNEDEIFELFDYLEMYFDNKVSVYYLTGRQIFENLDKIVKHEEYNFCLQLDHCTSQMKINQLRKETEETTEYIKTMACDYKEKLEEEKLQKAKEEAIERLKSM